MTSEPVRQELDEYIHGALAPGFFGLLMLGVVDRLVEGGVPAAEAAGISVPVRAFSTMALLNQADQSVTELAPRLGVTHAAVIKTARQLEALGLVERRADPGDARRKPLSLTAEGREEAALILSYMDRAARVYRGLFEEAGMDLFKGMQALNAALDRESFSARMARN